MLILTNLRQSDSFILRASGFVCVCLNFEDADSIFLVALPLSAQISYTSRGQLAAQSVDGV